MSDCIIGAGVDLVVMYYLGRLQQLYNSYKPWFWNIISRGNISVSCLSFLFYTVFFTSLVSLRLVAISPLVIHSLILSFSSHYCFVYIQKSKTTKKNRQWVHKSTYSGTFFIYQNASVTFFLFH